MIQSANQRGNVLTEELFLETMLHKLTTDEDIGWKSVKIRLSSRRIECNWKSPGSQKIRLTVNPLKWVNSLYVVRVPMYRESALFQHWVSLMDGRHCSKRIALPTDRLGLQSASLISRRETIEDFEQNRRYWDMPRRCPPGREQNPACSDSHVLLNLVAKRQRTGYRIIGEHIDENDDKKAVAFRQHPCLFFRQLNTCFNLGTLKVSLNNYNDEEKSMAKHQDTRSEFNSMCSNVRWDRASSMAQEMGS